MEKEKIPPGQKSTTRFPVLHEGRIPGFDETSWDFTVEGEIEDPLRMSWKDFQILPRVRIVSDFHCVTGWSRLDNEWEGVRFSEIARMAKPKENVGFVTVVAEQGYTTSLPLDEMMDDDVLLDPGFDGEPLPPKHGGPIRLVVTKKYA